MSDRNDQFPPIEGNDSGHNAGGFFVILFVAIVVVVFVAIF